MMMIRQEPNMIYRLAQFIIGNIPTTKELFLTSVAQSFVEIILDNTGLEQGFGNNPTAKSFMRDGAKIVTAPYYAYTNTPVGGQYVADTFTALGAVTKGPIKVATMSMLKSASSKNVGAVDFTRLDKVVAHTNFDRAVLNEVKSLYLQYAKDGSQLGTFSRLSNFVAEPITKTLEGCSKALQDEALRTGLEYRNTGVLDTIMNIKKFGIEQFLGYSLGNSLIKTSVLDLFGDYYGKMGVYGMLKSARETIEQHRVNFVFGRATGGEFQIKHKMTLSHRVDMVNKAVDSAFHNLDYSYSLTSIAWYFLAKTAVVEYALSSYGLEMLERTAYNTFTMSVLATPARAVGNAIHYLDNINPLLVRVLGPVGGGAYVASLYAQTGFKAYIGGNTAITEKPATEQNTLKCAVALVQWHVQHAQDSADVYQSGILDMIRTSQDCVDYATEQNGISLEDIASKNLAGELHYDL